MAAVADIPTATAAPPTDPVRAALDDPTVKGRLLAAARAGVRGKAIEAEEVVQEACTRAWANRGRFDTGAGTPVTAWLAGFVRNVVREKLRELGVAQLPDTSQWDKAVAPSHEVGLRLEEDRARCHRFLASLPPKYRQVMEMRFLRERDDADIAADLGISRDNVRARVARAKKMILELAATEDRS